MPNTQNPSPMPEVNMPYAPNPQQQPPEEEKKKKRGAGFYIGIIVAIVAIVAAIVIAIFMFMDSTQYRGGSLGQLDGKTQEEIQAELDRVVQEGMMSISISSVVEFENGTSEGEWKIENSPANHYLMQVEVAISDTGEVIYTSEILEPNYHIQYAALDVDLPAGSYPCTATFFALDPDTEQLVGQTAARVTVIVDN